MSADAGNGARTPFPSRPRADAAGWPVIALGFFLAIAVVALLGFELLRERGEIESEAFRETRNVAALLDSYVGQSMGSAAEVLRDLADMSKTALLGGSVNSPVFRTQVEILPAGLPQIGGLVVLDASGRVLVSTWPSYSPGMTLSSEDYYRRIVASAEGQTTLDIGTLRHEEQSGRWLIPMSLGIEGADGKLIGVALVIIDPRAFLDLFRSLDIDPFSAVTLMQNDGVIVARSAEADRFVGRTIAGGELDRSIAAQSSAGSIRVSGLLAGGIAHDFNNLLGAIANFAGLLVDDLKGRKSEQTYASRIAEACEYGKEVVMQLLAYARPIAESPSKTDLRAVLSQMEMLVRPALPASAQLSVEPGPMAVPVMASKSQLTQILVNLCLNARDALTNGAGTIAVRLSIVGQSDPDHPASIADDARSPATALRRAGTADPTRAYAAVTVSDTGMGIHADTLSRIFEPFFSTKRAGKGTGLGLAIVDSTVLSLGGLYAVESKIGIGTCFSIYLPMAGDELAAGGIAERRIEAQLWRA